MILLDLYEGSRNKSITFFRIIIFSKIELIKIYKYLTKLKHEYLANALDD
jgi:hypothetical protein